MKVIFLAVTCLLALSGALANTQSCYKDVTNECSATSSSLKLQACNALYGEYGASGHGHIAIEMQSFANLHLERSFEYLLSASYFSNYKTNREGFSKLFRKLADDTWGKTIDIIKHITMRGGEMNFAQRSTRHRTPERKNYTAELHELEALSKALDTQKELAERAFHIHKEATRTTVMMPSTMTNTRDPRDSGERHVHDPEIAQYLEEEFIEYQAKQIREIAGHTRDLRRFVTSNNGQDLSLSLYLFDEYLQKIA